MTSPIPTRFWLLLMLCGMGIAFFLYPLFTENRIPEGLFMVILWFLGMVVVYFRRELVRFQNILTGGILVLTTIIGTIVFLNLIGGI